MGHSIMQTGMDASMFQFRRRNCMDDRTDGSFPLCSASCTMHDPRATSTASLCCGTQKIEMSACLSLAGIAILKRYLPSHSQKTWKEVVATMFRVRFTMVSSADKSIKHSTFSRLPCSVRGHYASKGARQICARLRQLFRLYRFRKRCACHPVAQYVL